MPAVDVAVIGGGIAGTAVAAFLAEAGLGVRLYERSAIAAGASGRNSGIVQHPFDPLLAGLYDASLAEYRGLVAASDGTLAFGDEPAGLLYVGHDPDAANRVSRDWLAAWPATSPTVLSGAELERLEPGLALDLVACRLDIGFPMAPAAATEAFATHGRRHAVEFVLGRPAQPALAGDRIVGVSVDGRVEPADMVVVAGGPWTPAIIDPTGSWQPIGRAWGVVANVVLADAPRHGLEAIDIAIEPDLAPIAGEGGGEDAAAVEFSLVPAAGSSALGSTFLPDEPDPARWIDALRRVGSRYVPGVAAGPLAGVRCCARPVSLDGRPLIGRAPWVDGLWILAGHGPWGISTGPGSARLLTDQLLGRPDAAAIPPELGVGRFGVPPG
jgi:glycine/D-amino acid oxidase-like deaminating enzyme